MLIMQNNEIGITRNSAINEFIIVRVIFINQIFRDCCSNMFLNRLLLRGVTTLQILNIYSALTFVKPISQ